MFKYFENDETLKAWNQHVVVTHVEVETMAPWGPETVKTPGVEVEVGDLTVQLLDDTVQPEDATWDRALGRVFRQGFEAGFLAAQQQLKKEQK